MATPSKDYTVKAFTVTEANTVHYVVTEVFEISSEGIVPIKDSTISTRLRVYKQNNKFRKESSIMDDTRISRKDTKNDFFFIAPKRGEYSFVISLSGSGLFKYKSIGVDYKIFTGEENRPSIVSANDVEVNKAEILIKGILDYAKSNLVTQELEFKDEKVPVNIYGGIIKTAVIMVILKIIATLGTAYYSNLKTKKFFASQNLGNK